ncbi:MAG: EAL domain-containing protein, partial [Gammaproteobacteria bacterium]
MTRFIQWLLFQPLKRKLLWVIMIIVLTTVVATSSFLYWQEVKQQRQDFIRNNLALAKLVAEYTVLPLVFDDMNGAEEQLSKLWQDPRVVYVRLEKANEQILVNYDPFNDAITAPLPEAKQEWLWQNNRLYFAVAVNQAHEKLGVLRGAFRVDELSQTQYQEQRFMLGVMLIAMLCSYGMALMLRRFVMTSIKQLEHHARRIADQSDMCEMIEYPVQRKDEISHLYEAFNLLMGRIQKREAEILQFNSNLENKIRQRTQDLEDSQRILALSLQASNQWLWDWNVVSGTLQLDAQLVQLCTLLPPESITINWFSEHIHLEDQSRIQQLQLDLLNGRQSRCIDEFRLRTADGSFRWIHSQGQVIEFDSQGIALRMIGTHIDITARKVAEEQIKNLAFYDPLTQLPNRRLLQERLKHGIDVDLREGRKLALLMLDLDRFKAVNDSLGHLAGDELLQQVAARIIAKLRAVDMVARLGGDEFVVLLEDISHPEDAARVAEEIIDDLSKPFCLNQNDNVQIGASIGISLYPQHGENAQILMEAADAALYQAKDAGRGSFAYFSEDLTLAARERIAVETRLRRAIVQQELRVFYQPQVDIASDLIVGAEALVRWQDPVEGLIPPVNFITIAEETGQINEIGEWVLRETCRQGRLWLDEGLPPITLAVNVSPHQFNRSDICALVAKILAETGFPAEQLELEITESGLMGDQDRATAILTKLRAQGVHLAIDDFGTGYSSLAYLKHFPLDVLKIDKSFIDDIPF